jgi:hypothetical protein
VLAARMWLHRAPKMAARDVMHSWNLTSHLPPPRLSSHGPARFGLSPALPSVPPAPPAMPSSSVCSGNASAPSFGALKRLNVPFLFRYLRAYAWQRAAHTTFDRTSGNRSAYGWHQNINLPRHTHFTSSTTYMTL